MCFPTGHQNLFKGHPNTMTASGGEGKSPDRQGSNRQRSVQGPVGPLPSMGAVAGQLNQWALVPLPPTPDTLLSLSVLSMATQPET